MKKHIGIVLKKCAYKKRIAFIFDYNLGKLKCVPNRENIVLGSVITYFITNNRSPYFIELLETVHIPFDAAISDILFLHHILETCYNFIPTQSPSEDVFILIKYLYLSSNRIKCKVDKKLFLCKLFMLLGLYPEGIKFQTPYFCSLATEPIDKTISKKLHLKNEIELDNWLHCCVTTYPEFSDFKTINFLYK
ncbi:hypothetical protein ACFLYU_05125 [Candidatus Dependentiae bacterium]